MDEEKPHGLKSTAAALFIRDAGAAVRPGHLGRNRDPDDAWVQDS